MHALEHVNHAGQSGEEPPRPMDSVTSKDGTPIAYERRGSGPAVILVGGGLDDGSENAPLAAGLAARFTTYNYARRGRGASGDTPPYAVERELEDIAALIANAGGRAHVYGASSGGMFALEAALAGLPIGRIALYEIPYDTTDGAAERFDDYREQLDATLSDGRRGDAIELFMRLAGSPTSRSPRLATRPSGGASRRLRIRSPTTPRFTVRHRPLAWPRSRSRRWSRRVGAPSSTRRRPTRSRRACAMRSA